MRILRIDDWSGAPGGGQEYVRSVSDELARRGHENRTLCVVDTLPAPPRSDERYIVVPSTRGRRTPLDVLGSSAVDRAIGELLRTFRPDLVHLHHFGAAFSTIAHRLAHLPAPLVFTAHDAELVCPISTLVLPGGTICDGGIRSRCLFTGCPVGWGGPLSLHRSRTFRRFVAPQVRAYLCPSALLVQYLDSNGFQPAIHLPSFARIPAAVREAPYPFPPSDAPPTIGFLGRLEWYKGVDDLIDAVALLAERRPSIRLDIAGDGSMRSELEHRARQKGVHQRTTFRGDLRGAAKEEWFRSIPVLAVPSSQWENFGLVALEAQARGRPVVATRFGGLPDIVVDGQTGRLVPLSDPPALARALDALLGDRDAAMAWGTAGRRRVLAQFTPSIHVERLLAVYRAILDGRRLTSRTAAETLRDDNGPRVASDEQGAGALVGSSGVPGGPGASFEPESQARQT